MKANVMMLTDDNLNLCTITAAKDATVPRIYDGNAYERFDRLLSKLRHRQCKDDRDRVYATLGIRPGRLRLNVTPDYSKHHERAGSRLSVLVYAS